MMKCPKWRFVLAGFFVLVTWYSIRQRLAAEVRKTDGRVFFYERESSFVSASNYNHTAKSVDHIAFLKIPKAASTTVQNIFLRYGDEKNLTFALPRTQPAGGPSLDSTSFFPPPENGTYDITCTHIPYNRLKFTRVLPKDTKYIGTVREPFSHFSSLIRYLSPNSVVGIPGENPVLDFLIKSEKYRNSISSLGYDLCNRMSFFYGLPSNLVLTQNEDEIHRYLHKLGNEMDLVLVLEYLDESIVLMRRLLNWDLRHVLYSKLNPTKTENPRLKFGLNEERLHKNCARLDIPLYKFFLYKFKELLKKQQADFYEELAYFKKTRIRYDDFCRSSLSGDPQDSEIAFAGSPWNRPFVITVEHCKRQYIHDVVYLNILKKKQHVLPDQR